LGQNLFEKSLRFRKSIDQVGGQDKVEGAKFFRDSKSIPSLKRDSFSIDSGRDAGDRWLGYFTFFLKSESDFSRLLKLLGCTNK